MHTCPPPGTVLDEWLKAYHTVVGSYGHLLLEQQFAVDASLVGQLLPYFESAHLDAREHFHAQAGMDLHPDAGAPGAHAQYPTCLPSTAKRGLFGEVMAGMLSEHYPYVGNYEWIVPIFLFRHHEDVERYLFDLVRDESRERAVFGRLGSDFLAISIDANGNVVRYLVGEAKWRKTLTANVVSKLLNGGFRTEQDGSRKQIKRGIWDQLNTDTRLPHGLRQLQRLISAKGGADWEATVASLDGILLAGNRNLPSRTNLVLICGNGASGRVEGDVNIDWEACPREYTSPHDLQVVELVLTDGEKLISALYGSLWGGA